MTPKVLLVDDVSMFVELQKDYLQLSSVQIFTARDGSEALRICQAEQPALVFMDLHMPVMNGADCCLAVKKDPLLRETRVVLITSEGKPADRTTCLAAGCDGFLTKPLDRQIFLDMARSLLPSINRRDQRAECQLKVKFRVFGLTLSGLIMNISQRGAYLATTYDLEKDAVMEMVFSLPGADGAIIQTKGRVAWENGALNRQKTSHPVGCGIEFLDLAGESEKALERFVRLNSF